MADRRIRIMLVDDHDVVRMGLRTLLEKREEFSVVGEAADVAEAITTARRAEPDVIVMDIRLPDGSGVEACREIRGERPETKVMMLTSFADEEALMAAILAGASGYVLKRVRWNELLESIRAVAQGGSLLDPEMTEKLFRRLRGDGHQEDPLLSKLSPQEHTILGHIAEGKTNKQIAEDMFLAEKTVKNYVSNMLAKLGMARRSEAAAYMARVTADKEEYPPEEWPAGSPPA